MSTKRPIIIPIYYKKSMIYLQIFILAIFEFIFLIGAVLFNQIENWIYLLLVLLPLWSSIQFLKKPYAEVSISEIKVRGWLGGLNKKYSLKSEQESFVVIDQKVYLKTAEISKKIKINSWFVNEVEWQHALLLLRNENELLINRHLNSD